MTKHTTDRPAIISLRQACRRVGISVATALKMAPAEFPEPFWLGGKRCVSREKFETWLAAKLGVMREP
jgi:predicted DNA-binding transcriptional regulator AlpA